MARNESSFHGKVEVHVPSVLAIPEDAILHTGENDLVYLFQDDQTLKPHAIKLGMKVNGYYLVLEGLKIDDEITTGANFLLDSEAKIRGTK
jgi:Cu(I)/Ag(I) efflux system membrane fusion protein